MSAPIVRNSWKPGPAAGSPGPFVISATAFTYRRYRDLPAVWYHGLRLRRGWGRRAGAVGLATGAHALRPVTFTLSVWTSREALRRFLGSPEHARLVRGFKRRQAAAAAVVWEAERFSLDAAWREGLRRLAERGER